VKLWVKSSNVLCKERMLDMVHSSHRILGLALSMAVPATIAAGCGPFQPHEIPDEGAVSGAGGNGGAGGLGQGGSDPSVCEPGMIRDCYTGYPGTEGIGICRPGRETCNATGTGFGACEGEITPQPENCENSVDEDCDGKTDAASECLVDRGLIVRYFINEADSGQGPAALEDAAPDPLPLAITYTPELTFTSVDGHRGLTWSDTENDGMASRLIDNTKLKTALKDSQTGTIEVVTAIDAVATYSRISYIGQDSFDIFSLNSGDADHFLLNRPGVDNWVTFSSPNYKDLKRMTMHLVLDTSREVPAERATLYINGELVTGAAGVFPDKNEKLTIPQAQYYVLGNMHTGDRSFKGTLYYAAMYSAALTGAEAKMNAALLLLDDDAL
jgi:hypothetical protein